jgi:pimeloyl-ACP methyl ester carboxylesterase
MTNHYFENELVKLHYYKFGEGQQNMLCFHGYGMHGKQFKILETTLGSKYTFYGFDLFFHKETKLTDQSLRAIKNGISKKELAALFADFCGHEGIDRFSVIGYSMGTHFATIVVEELAPMVAEYIIAAPSSLNPGALISFFSKNKAGNKILEKIALSKNALTGMLKLFKRLKFINSDDYKILYNEIGTPELRFSFYACFTYLRFLETDEPRLLQVIEEQNIKSIFIFGKRDKSFPPRIGDKFIAKLKHAEIIILDESHEMIKKSFVTALTKLLL